MRVTYESDFYGWTQEQAELLRSGHPEKLDAENLLEEIEAMGRSERRELVSCLKVLLAHLLKWEYQPDRRTTSWQLTIMENRRKVPRCLRDSPSLKHRLVDSIRDAYEDAVFAAAKETQIKKGVFPELCPWSFAQIIDDKFYPE